MPKLKRQEAGSRSIFELQKLQRLYTQGAAAYGSVRNLVKASNLSVSKVRPFLHSKPSYKKFFLPTRKFKQMEAFARFRTEISCMGLAYIDKIAKVSNGVKYLQVRQDLFDRTVGAKGMKTKESKEAFPAFLSLITKQNHRKKRWVYKGTEVAGEFKKLRKAEGIQIYSTMSETKVAFAERKNRSRKNILYHYMEDKGYKYFHKLTQFVATLSSRRNCSVDLIPKNVKNSDFFPFCTENNYENLRNSSLKLEIVFASRSPTHPSGSVISHSLRKKLSKLSQFLPENLQHTH